MRQRLLILTLIFMGLLNVAASPGNKQKTFQLFLAEDAKVRIGNAEESGAKGALSDLKVGDVVKVYLSSPKEAKGKEEAGKPKGNIKGTITSLEDKFILVRGSGSELHLEPTPGREILHLSDRQVTLIVIQKDAGNAAKPPASVVTPSVVTPPTPMPTKLVPVAIPGTSLPKQGTRPGEPEPKLVTFIHDYELLAADNVLVRVPHPPEVIDPKTGEYKRYTLEELQEAKGPSPAEQKRADFKAAFSDLRIGDKVGVRLATPKKAAPKKGNETSESEAREKDEFSWTHQFDFLGSVVAKTKKTFTVRQQYVVPAALVEENEFTRVLDRQAVGIVVLKRALEKK